MVGAFWLLSGVRWPILFFGLAGYRSVPRCQANEMPWLPRRPGRRWVAGELGPDPLIPSVSSQAEENDPVAWTRRELALRGSVALQAAPYHGDAINEAQHSLRLYFKRSRHHSGDLLIATEMEVYFDPPDGPWRKLRPDLFVAFGVARRPEATSYRVSEQGKPPDFVLEVSSPSTVKRDVGSKRKIYAAAGVPEYWLFDPLGEHLQPRLQGYRLADGQYLALAVTRTGDESAIWSPVLGTALRTQGAILLVQDPGRQRAIPTIAEMEAMWLTHMALEETNSQAEQEAGSQADENLRVQRATEVQTAHVESQRDKLKVRLASPRSPRGR